jgi:ElaB/YqjD/DUF883 family membrane-anchored ribosome-binding protein
MAGALSCLIAGETPEDTYREVKAGLETLWAAEEKLLTGIIQAQEKHLAHLRERARKADPRFPNIRESLQQRVEKAEDRLANSRAYLGRRERDARQTIDGTATRIADVHKDMVRRGEDARQKIQAEVDQARREIGQKLDQAADQIDDTLGEIRQRTQACQQDLERKINEFRGQVETAAADPKTKNAQLAGRYGVSYNLAEIETNLGVKKQVLSLEEFAELHFGGSPRAPLVPAELVAQIRSLPAEVDVQADGIGFTVTVAADGRTAKMPGLIDYGKGKFIGGGTGGALFTPLGTLLHTVTIEGDFTLVPAPSFSGRLISALTLWREANATGLYVAIPFEAKARK